MWKQLRSMHQPLLRPVPRKIAHACVPSIFASLLVSATTFAATPVDGKDYRFSIAHRVVSQTPLANGKVAMELELTLDNAGDHSLYDLRLFLIQAGPVSTTQQCEPARLQELHEGRSDGVTVVYECLNLSLPEAALKQIRFRVEAVDVATQEIVSFASSSQESR